SPENLERLINGIFQYATKAEEHEFSEGHLENALNIDVTADDFDAKVATLDKEKPVMVYCKLGGRSSKAATRLKELGFKNITDLEGGIMNWKSENKKIVE
uniref:rhodanese-like domain-containing protein n=1 Tax=Flavobacterium sp. TaxID=239 RepID=UPI00404974F6